MVHALLEQRTVMEIHLFKGSVVSIQIVRGYLNVLYWNMICFSDLYTESYFSTVWKTTPWDTEVDIYVNNFLSLGLREESLNEDELWYKFW